MTPLPGLAAAYPSQTNIKPAPYGFLLFNHANGTSVNPDTLYVADQNYGLLKFYFDGTNWNFLSEKVNGNAGSTFEGLTGYETLSDPNNGNMPSFTLYATSAASGANPTNQLLEFTDNSAYNDFLTTGNFTLIATATNSTDSFSGLTFVPLNTTTTSVASNHNPSVSGQSVVFTATVNDTTGTYMPTGTVTFTVDGVAQTPVNLSGSGTTATAALTGNSSLSVGNHTVTAVYNGDSNDGTSVSAALSQVVLATTNTTLTDNGPNPSSVGGAVSFTTTVSGGASISGETVQIEDASNGNAVVATPTLSGGTASFSISTLTAGTHNLFAVYTADPTHAGSQSSQVSQVVSAGVAPTVTSVMVNGVKVVDGLGTTENLAGQNSVVANLLVTFNEAVTLDSNAFTLAALPVSGTGNPGTIFVGGGNQPYQGNVAISVHAVTSTGAATSSPSQYYEINFTGAGSDYATDVAIGNSVTTLDGNATAVIRDGVFNLTTAAGAVHANGQTMASSNTNTFWKMYGSVGNANTLSTTAGDGNSEVAINSTDAGVFRTAFGLSEESDGGPFNPALDSNLDGFIDATDASRFRNNFSNDWGF